MTEAASPNQTILRNQRKCSQHSSVCCNNDILYGSDYATQNEANPLDLRDATDTQFVIDRTTPLDDLLNKTNFQDVKDQSSSGELLLF